MPLLKEQNRQALVQEFAAMTGRVRLVFFTQALDCDTCNITGQLLDEVAALGEKIELVTHNFAIDRAEVERYAIARVPAFAVVRLDELQTTEGTVELREHDYGIRFYGVPSGYEFTSFIGAILDVSSADSHLSSESRALIAQINSPAHIQVFTTPT
jgi:alkyl hydroperoxide reductase subunit AhpF